MEAPLTARILIVDDDERNAFAAVQALESLGHELVVARSGEEALRRLLDEDYAVILLDLHMPGMDGYETAALIRSRRRSAGIPIVFLTAIFRDEAHVFQAYSAGAVDVVFKPVDPFILRSKVQVLVELHLKTMEVKRQADYRQLLLDEHARMKSEKASAERALRRARQRQEAILDSLPIVFHSRLIEPPFAPVFVSEGVRAMTGFDAQRFVDEPEFGFSRVHPDDRRKLIDALGSAVRGGAYACEYRWRCEDGSYRVLLDQGVLAPGLDGEGQEIFGVMLDATDRRSLEEQLAQARKMETVGQLTGGVAHDFNNLLTVVLGNVDLLTRREEQDARRQRQLGAIRHAAERGRSLTRQLLAFSRRQHLNPVTLDVNALIGEFAPLMRQAMGEAVELDLVLGDGELCVHADAAQLETALLNLAVNARDAMGGEGRLSISTETVAPDAVARLRREGAEGDWVRIRVRDTGCGMAPEVLERVFEPFFTTKEVGKGSGLGLSQLYGFVSQSGGYVEVESAPGQGTAFELLLPATEAPPAECADAEAEAAPTGTERVLAVEDDPAVLALAVDLLKGLGYQVATAANAPEALELLRAGGRFDILFSDVVMPGGASGLQLARAAREIDPDMKVLLTSGYVGQIDMLSDMEFALIDKPYEGAELARKLREVLDAPPGGRAAQAPRRRARAVR